MYQPSWPKSRLHAASHFSLILNTPYLGSVAAGCRWYVGEAVGVTCPKLAASEQSPQQKECFLDGRTLPYSLKLFVINHHLLNYSPINRPCHSQASGTPKSGSGCKGPLMPLHFLCIQHKQPSQKIELLPTPVRQTTQGSFPDSFSKSRLMPDTITFVFSMYICRLFFSISDFHVFNFSSSSSMDSTLIVKSSAYSSCWTEP